MDQNSVIERGGFFFIYNFDSGNLGRVERVPTELIAPSVASQKTVPTEIPDFEFNLWTRPDCAGTEFENGNRTWFYFGVQASEPNVLVRLNLINLNKQGKMYAQGMAPVTRTLPGKPQWERIRDRPVHNTDDNTFTLSFKYRTSDNTKATTFFAFTYPFSFAELQIALNSIDMKMLPLPPPQTPDDIYYHRECLIYSLEGRRVDLLTISSHHGITTDREERLKNLFPERHERPFKFQNKKVIFISARVHPGETPSSFVFNGFLNLLLNPNDPIAIQLRKVYVFKMIPFLNPDGVARGHYRTDTRGVNLNRVYLNPSLSLHPTVFASRALIRFYHYGCEKEDSFDDTKSYASRSIQNVSESSEYLDSKKKRLPGGYKGGDYGKRAVQGGDKNIGKAASGNKSITTLKQPSDASKRESSSVYKIGVEAGALADQVYDMSIRESQTSASQPSQPSQPTGTKRKEERTKRSTANERTNGPSLLNEQVLRSCLGSNVHLSNSDELNLSGGNPMRPLRDTLKDSISLLLGSTSSNADTSLAEKEPRLTNVRMGWCAECRANVFKLEHSMPSIGGVVPGFNDSTVNQAEQPGANARIPSDRVSIQTTFSSIDEYRESQQKQFEDAALLKEAQRLEAENALEAEREEGAVYFCTNCFKRYMLTENNEEVLCETVSSVLTTVSAGDSGSIRAAPPGPPPGPAASTGDTLPCSRPSKEERPRNKGGLRKKQSAAKAPPPPPAYKEVESGLYLYLDLHGHASKKGIFMYGNHFEDLESCVECMLLPRIMSLNNLHFHFSSCNFTERNMYLKDRRDGMSREGSGRVAVFKATGLVRSYTLECNYNTGRLVNVLPPTVHEGPGACQLSSSAPLPPKYTPHIFEEVGRSLGASILDLTGQHPNSRIPCSEHRNVTAVREWLRSHTKTMRPQLTIPRVRPKTASPPRVPLYARSKAKVTDERKENAYRGDGERRRADPAPAAPLAPRPAADVVNLNLRVRAPPATPSRSRFLLDESKPKALTAKRRNVLSIRKPNASKTHVGARPAARKTRRGADDAAGSRASLSAKLSKRSFARGAAVPHGGVPRALASSSSEEQLGEAWPHAAPDALAGRRRPYPRAPATHLKKIRLKAAL